MSMPHYLGTLIRCHHVEERRIAFYQEIGLNCVQIAGVYEPYLAPTPEAHAKSDEQFALFQKYGLDVPTMFLSFPGKEGVGMGFIPPEARAERMVLACRQMLWGKRYGVKYVTCHVGFLPNDNEPFYQAFISDLKQIVQFAAEQGQDFLLEIGSEPVPGLKRMLADVGMPNMGINFDPANFLWYGSDVPANMLRTMPEAIKVVHCKDANPALPGQPHGLETVLGLGSTRFAELLTALVKTGFSGPLIFERELPFGPEQEADVKDAVQFIKAILARAQATF